VIELKFATSIMIFFVLKSTSAFSPPFMPAIASGSFSSAIIKTNSSSFTSYLSSVIIFSPFFTFLTILFSLSNLSKSQH